MITYEQFSHFAGTWGLVLLVTLFVVAVAYALWPGNRRRFDKAANQILDDDDGAAA